MSSDVQTGSHLLLSPCPRPSLSPAGRLVRSRIRAKVVVLPLPRPHLRLLLLVLVVVAIAIARTSTTTILLLVVLLVSIIVVATAGATAPTRSTDIMPRSVGTYARPIHGMHGGLHWWLR